MDDTHGGRRWWEPDAERTGNERGHSATSRRQFLRAAGTSAVAAGAGTGLATAQTATTEEQEPFDGPHEVPCLIPAAHFDRGGEGVAYHEASPETSYGDYRDASVDTQPSPEGGHYVGWIEAGEWWEYTVEAPESGYHSLLADRRRRGGARNRRLDRRPGGLDVTPGSGR